jgi:dTDP-4-dehydrorhamnose reductase
MQKVLVLGGTGMLGQMVYRVLSQSEGLTVKCTSRSQLSDPLHFNVEDGPARLRQILERHGAFDYIVNCIGVVKAHIDERDSDSVRRAIIVNALFPHQLASVAAESDARVVQLSTDGVFSGDSGEPYLEDAPHDCVDVYGKTKSLGEVLGPGFLNIRCSIIGPDPIEKKGLLEWFLAQPNGKELVGYTDHLWNGVTTLQFAGLCKRIIVQDCFAEIWNESPVHHFCPNRPVSKYELLEIFKSAFGKHVMVRPSCSNGSPVRRILATRYLSLKNLFGSDLSMEQAVRELLDLEFAN